MNLSDLSKDTRKKILIGILGAILIIGMLYLVGLPLLRNRKAQKTELDDLMFKIKKADDMIDHQAEMYTVLEAKTETLAMTYTQMLPPDENTFVWATERMSDYASRAGIDINSINEVRIKPPSWGIPPDQNKEQRKNTRYFVPYQVNIDLKCGYADLKKLLRLIQRENKYASISSISIAAQAENPAEHSVAVTVEWPSAKRTAEKGLDEIIAHGLLDTKGRESG